MIKAVVGIMFMMVCFTGCLNSQETFRYNEKGSTTMTLVDGWTNSTEISISENNNVYSLLGVYKKSGTLHENTINISGDYFKIKGIHGKTIMVKYKSIDDIKYPNRRIHESVIEFDQAMECIEIFKNGTSIAKISDERMNLDSPLIKIRNLESKGIEWSVDGHVDSVDVYNRPFNGKGRFQLLDYTLYGAKQEKFSSIIKQTNDVGVLYFIVTKKLKFYISYYVPSHGFIVNFKNLEKEYHDRKPVQ